MALRETDPAEVGGYHIEDRLGSGGMGVVYLARSASGRRLALKVVHAQYADDDEFRIRFRREVAAARQVSGAFTAPVVDADADAARPWMATLYIPGEDLGTHVRRHGHLPLPKLRELAAGLAEALRDIHRAGMVHRDLKPANVMLAEDGPRVIDFGISRAAEFAAQDVLTQTGRVMGTPPFMSPEQFSSPQDVGPAADIFSLGSVVAYAATGRGPFDSPSPYETAIRVVDGDPELDGVPDELLPFVHLCLEKHPKSRPSAGELLDLLRDGRLPEPRPAPETGPTPDEPAAPRRRGRRRLLLASLVSALLLAAATTLTVVAVNAEPTPAERDLPTGWQAWHKKSKDPSVDKDPIGADAPFSRCAATGSSLVCAGDDVMATRFALADGRNTWARPIDETTDDLGSGDLGTIIAARSGRVYVYGADDRTVGENEFNPTRYTIQALDAETGKVIWKTVTGDSDEATEPNSDHGASAAVPEGIVTVYGAKGQQYALLDAADGKVRWKRPMPDPDTQMCLLRSAARHAYLVCQKWSEEDITGTSVAQLDPATGRPRWTVQVTGEQDIVGAAAGRLVVLNTTGTRREVTLINTASHVVTNVRLSPAQPEAATPTLLNDRLYFTFPSGSVRAVAPDTGRQIWESNSTVESSGPPIVSGSHLYLASPSGRLAALDLRTGAVEATLQGRDDGGTAGISGVGAPLVLVGDALYVPYGIRSVYSVDVRNL
ncbi:serine/threonine-protein kinase [Streptomyces sp. ISL-22]|uniref:serine/threonine-protein kinase n=1 Tax=unclassified Streptomyces TaxID=2593676 RepID=UPI001BEAB6BC|nr:MULTISPECIES: serine/threonine-protein kinase [unclassified Streptomyces]MBT2417207.1 serine/threonine-protein kinase [Streptomyces sp. ISL-24]MBT2438225.1 serine/threonine-protein kinase [Streptomyces sp. ISL-22]